MLVVRLMIESNTQLGRRRATVLLPTTSGKVAVNDVSIITSLASLVCASAARPAIITGIWHGRKARAKSGDADDDDVNMITKISKSFPDTDRKYRKCVFSACAT